jgi:hypothetical protein
VVAADAARLDWFEDSGVVDSVDGATKLVGASPGEPVDEPPAHPETSRPTRITVPPRLITET